MTRASEIFEERPSDGGTPARRAVMRWAWRLLRREWRQQLLVLGLIGTVVAVTTVGVAVSTNTPLSPYVGFGNARDLATFSGNSAEATAKIASWQRQFGVVDVIDNETVRVPGSIDTFDLRAQNSSGPYGQPLLAVVSGHFPTTSSQVAVTSGVASEFNLNVGSQWRELGVTRQVVGIVENPENLLAWIHRAGEAVGEFEAKTSGSVVIFRGPAVCLSAGRDGSPTRSIL